jgi:hypothetical protein
MNIKRIEYGVIGLILDKAPSLYDVKGSLTTQIDADTNISSLTLTLATPPSGLNDVNPSGGIWLTGNAGDYQRFEYKAILDNTDGTYTFTLSKLTKVKSTVLVATDSFVERSDLPIFEYGDLVDSQDYDFIQVKTEKPEQEYPNMKGDAANLWKLSVMAAVVNRIAQDKDRSKLCEEYNTLESVFVRYITATDLSVYSGVQILGILQSESEDGRWDNERQGLIAEVEIKYLYE